MLKENKKEQIIKKEETFEKNHIGVLDGIRALAIVIIVWYHFWQQSWITPTIGPINIDWLIRNGSILVDIMIFLSAFCLFLPYARKMVYGEETDTVKQFYQKRIARIFPSYYICLIIILAFFVLPNGEYSSAGSMLKDIFSHGLFIQNYFLDTLVGTKLNGVLWTVALEVQYYVIFPLLAKAFVKKPKTTYFLILSFGLISSFIISKNFNNLAQPLYVNHPFTFATVYANGMLGAWVYMVMTKQEKRTDAQSLFYTIIAILSLFIFYKVCSSRQQYTSETKWQIDYRFLLSLIYLVFTVSTIMSLKLFRKIFDNRLTRFISSISYNLYIWHQFIAVKLKEYHIPIWEGETPPNMQGDKVWQWKYMLLCIIISILVACLMTYCVEKPIAKMLKKKWKMKNIKSMEMR